MRTAKINPTIPIVSNTDLDAPTSALAIALPLAAIAATLVTRPKIERIIPKIATRVTFHGRLGLASAGGASVAMQEF
jgi:hypothetical protein